MEELIVRYFNACTNLYGMIPMKRVYRIIEKQNPELKLTKEQFTEIVNKLDFSHTFYDILSEEEVYGEDADETDLLDKILIAEYILMFGDPEDYERLAEEQGGRPFYVPEKTELLRYQDEFYHERTRQILSLEAYVRDVLGVTNYQDVVEELVLSLVIEDVDPNEALETLARLAIPRFPGFRDSEQAKNYFVLYTELRNHTRKHTHRGHTPSELDDCFEPTCIAKNDRLIKVTPPSKNGKCPCGSGKKYKRCCGKEQP